MQKKEKKMSITLITLRSIEVCPSCVVFVTAQKNCSKHEKNNVLNATIAGLVIIFQSAEYCRLQPTNPARTGP